MSETFTHHRLLKEYGSSMEDSLPNPRHIDDDDIFSHFVDFGTSDTDLYDMGKEKEGRLHTTDFGIQCENKELMLYKRADKNSPNTMGILKTYIKESEQLVIDTQPQRSVNILSNDSNENYYCTPNESIDTESGLDKYTLMQRKHALTLKKLKEVAAKLQEIQFHASTSNQLTNWQPLSPFVITDRNNTLIIKQVVLALVLPYLYAHWDEASQQIYQIRLNATNIEIVINSGSSTNHVFIVSLNAAENLIGRMLSMPTQWKTSTNIREIMTSATFDSIVKSSQFGPPISQLWNTFNRDLNEEGQQKFKLVDAVKSSWLLILHSETQTYVWQLWEKSVGARMQDDHHIGTVENREIRRQYRNSCLQLNLILVEPYKDPCSLAIAYNMSPNFPQLPNTPKGYHPCKRCVESAIQTASRHIRYQNDELRILKLPTLYSVLPLFKPSLAYPSKYMAHAEFDYPTGLSSRLHEIVLEELPDLIPEIERAQHNYQHLHIPNSPEYVEPINPQIFRRSDNDPSEIAIAGNWVHYEEIGVRPRRYHCIKRYALLALLCLPITICCGIFACIILRSYMNEHESIKISEQPNDDISRI